MKFYEKTAILCSVICFILCANFTQVPIWATENTAHNWYFKLSENNIPQTDEQFKFIENYNGYYFNPQAAKNDDKVIYLTFDAGYENGNIEKILDALNKHNAKGTFFVLENLIKRNPELICRMVNEGHTVANHTATHPDMTKKTNLNDFKAELDRLNECYQALTGETISPFYRPPEGKFSESNLKFADQLGYKTIFWSFAYADWDNAKQPDAEKSIQKILKRTHNGEIILLHPTSATNAQIMDTLLTEWENMGYRFGLLTELEGN